MKHSGTSKGLCYC